MENRNMLYERKFWDILEDLFTGAEVEGKSGYVNLLKVKRKYFKNYLKPNLSDYINEQLKNFPEFKEEVYQKLYSFFHRYFSETGSIYFSYTPLYYKIYDKVYKNEETKEVYFKPSEFDYNTDFEQILSDKEDVSLFWKTHMLYYIKTDKIIRSMKVEIPEEALTFYFDASEIELKKANEKKQLIYELKEVKEDGTIVLKVLYSERGKKTKEKEIIKQVKKAYKYSRITEEFLNKAIKTFEKQANVDYFINKNAEKFLKEQFDLWMYQYLFSQEVNFDLKRFQQLQALKSIAYRIIEFIAQFEDELRKIWEKPRLVFNSNYVITLDRIAKKENGFEVIKEIINQLKEQEKEFIKNLKELEKVKNDYKSFKERFENHNIKNQLEEWYLLDIIDENFKVDEVVEKKLHGLELNEKWQFLPVDTKYFDGLKEKIEEMFDIDEELDGRLIKSENWQALNTILPKYKGKIQTIYIDPPYNTGSDEFMYEDKFRFSSWLTMLENRLSLAKEFLKKKGVIFVSIGDLNPENNNASLLDLLMERIFKKRFGRLIWKKRGGIGSFSEKNMTENHEYILVYGNKNSEIFHNIIGEKLKKEYKYKDEKGYYRWISLLGPSQQTKEKRPNLNYSVLYDEEKNKILGFKQNGKIFPLWEDLSINEIETTYIEIKPPGKSTWLISKEVLKDYIKRNLVRVSKKNTGYSLEIKKYLIDKDGNIQGNILKSILSDNDIKIGMNIEGTKIINNMFSPLDFSDLKPKPVSLIKFLIHISTKKDDYVMDFFGGSGTTIQAVIEKNKEDKGNRKFLVIDMGNHFYFVLLPRIKKLSYRIEWENGKPNTGSESGNLFFKYYELEQYEDILKTIDYTDTDIKEYYEKLSKVLGEDFKFSKADPFIFDKKLAKAVEIRNKDMKIDISKLYPNKNIDEKEYLLLQNSSEKKEILKFLFFGR